MRIIGFCLKLVGGLALAALVAGLFGWIVQHLWNWLMPVLFHLPTVTFWQAAGLVLLSRLLFGNIGGGHHGKGWKKRHRKWHEGIRCCKPGKSSPFVPGFVHNLEHFDDWWEECGEASFKSRVEQRSRGWGWWKWWETEGRAEYERWLEDRRTAC